MSDNSVMRLFRKGGMGGLKRLHNEEIHALYPSPRRMKWEGHVAWMGEMRNAYNILGGKPERKGPLGRLRHKWEDNISLDLREIGWKGMDWMHLA
jgi:hypothetical protein